MKMTFLKNSSLAALLLAAAPLALWAQQPPEKPKDTKNRQQIVITRSGDKEEKMTIEIDGDKVKVNGKDVADLKDINVHVSNLKLPNMRIRTGDGQGYNMAWNDGQMQLFRADSLLWNSNRASVYKTDSSRAMLGVTTDAHDKGVLVQSVTSDGAADKAGLKKGDVITRIDTRRIQAVGDVTDAVRAHKPGDKVTVTYLRDDKEYKASAELTRWKGVDMKAFTAPRVFDNNVWQEKNQAFGGFEDFDRATPGIQGRAYRLPSNRPRLGLLAQDTDDGKGVKVMEVEEDGTAAKAGIKENDVITQVDGVAVNGADAIAKVIKEKGAQPSMQFQVLRAGKSQTIEVKVPRKLKTVDL